MIYDLERLSAGLLQEALGSRFEATVQAAFAVAACESVGVDASTASTAWNWCWKSFVQQG